MLELVIRYVSFTSLCSKHCELLYWVLMHAVVCYIEIMMAKSHSIVVKITVWEVWDLIPLQCIPLLLTMLSTIVYKVV